MFINIIKITKFAVELVQVAYEVVSTIHYATVLAETYHLIDKGHHLWLLVEPYLF